MATPNIVPRADQGGGLGTAAKSWGKLFIENAAAGGTAAVTISNLDVDKVAVDINALNTTANVLDITAGALNGGAGLFLNTANGQNDIKIVSSADAADFFTLATTTNGATTLTTVDGGTGSDAHFEIHADGNLSLTGEVFIQTADFGVFSWRKGLAAAADQFLLALGSNGAATFTTNDNAGAAAHFEIAADGNITLDSAGQIKLEPVAGNNVVIDTSVFIDGPLITIEDITDTGDKFTIATTTHGATTLTTTDDDATAAHFEIAADGNITLDSAGIVKVEAATAVTAEAGLGIFEFRKAGNADDYMGVGIGNNGEATFYTIDSAGTAANIKLQADGDITLDSAGQIKLEPAAGNNILLDSTIIVDAGIVSDVTAVLLTSVSGATGSLSTAAGLVFTPTTDDTFTMVSGANGATSLTTVDTAATAAHLTMVADGNITLDSAALTNIESVGLIKTTGAGVEIENAAASGAAALLIDNDDVDQFALHVSAANTTIPAMAISAPSLTTSTALNIVSNHASPDGNDSQSLMVDADFDGVGTSDFSGIHVDLNKDGITASGKTATVHGLKVDLDDSVNNVGTVHNYGVSVFNNYANAGSGATSAYGLYTNVGGADTNYDIYMENSADATEYAWMAVGAGGKLDITTVSDDASGHTRITADGDVDVDGLVITLDAATRIELEAATNVTGAVKSTGAVTGRNYRTMYIDAGGMVPAVTNGAIANTEEMHATNFTTLDFLSFSTSTEQYADFKMVMPEQYNNGTIKAKFYWKPADAEASVSVVWGIKAYAATDSDALTGASGVWGTEQVIEDVSLNTVDDLHISATTPAITIAGTPAEGKLVFVRVFRKVAAGADDYADAAELLGVNLQYVETETASAAW